MHTGICPSCESHFDHAYVENLEIRVQFSSAAGYRGVSYQCPHCRTVLGVGTDPVTLEADIVNAVKAVVRARQPA